MIANQDKWIAVMLIVASMIALISLMFNATPVHSCDASAKSVVDLFAPCLVK